MTKQPNPEKNQHLKHQKLFSFYYTEQHNNRSTLLFYCFEMRQWLQRAPKVYIVRFKKNNKKTIPTYCEALFKNAVFCRKPLLE